MSIHPLRRLRLRLIIGAIDLLLRWSPEIVQRYQQRSFFKRQAFADLWRAAGDDERARFLTHIGLPAAAVATTMARQKKRVPTRLRRRARK